MKQKIKITHLLYLTIAMAVAAAAWTLWPADPAPQPPASGGIQGVPPLEISGAVASIRVDGVVRQQIALDYAPDQEFSILEETGKDITFQVKDGAIRFLHAQCPDQICVNTGFIHEEGEIATCMPNRTVVTIVLDGTSEVPVC